MKPPWRYRLLVRLLSPVILGYTLWRALKDGGSRYWWQRLGYYPAADAEPADRREALWVHAASVGEVITVLPLIRAWQEESGGESVLVTTGTPTGAAVLARQDLPGLHHHQYLPIDFPGACRRFVDTLHTHNAWIVETEIWPWLYAHCERRGITLTIISGRLSARTMRQADGFMGSSYRRALTNVCVLARSEQDSDNFITLGAARQRVQVVGNLKHTGSTETQRTTSLLPRRYVLAASTHEDEELQLARRWLQAAPADSLLVIVPRHPERAGSILREFAALGVRTARRSAREQPAAEDQLYLADTLGELHAWYQYADATFVGGSLIPRGGHNMLEPARYSCPTVVGPHTGNFDDIMQLLLAADAVHVADCADDAADFLIDAAGGSPGHREMGRRAQQVAQDRGDVLQGYLHRLRTSSSG
jgi:3-deoxy-D-manno-octulosonic-acid transferase